MRYVCLLACCFVVGLFAGSTRAALADTPKEGDILEYSGLACFQGTPCRSGRDFLDALKDPYRIQVSQARLTLDFKQMRAVGRIDLRWEHLIKGKRNALHVARYEIEQKLHMSHFRAKPRTLGWYRLGLRCEGTVEHTGMDLKPKTFSLFGVWFRDGTVAVPKQEALSGDFILLYLRENDLYMDFKDVRREVRAGRLGQPIAVLSRVRSTRAPAEPPDPEPGAGQHPPQPPDPGPGAAQPPPKPPAGTIGAPSKKQWSIAHLRGKVEARVGEGKWQPLVPGMRIGKNVALRTGENGLLKIEIRARTKDGKGTYTQGELTLGPNSSANVRDPDASQGGSLWLGSGLCWWSAIEKPVQQAVNLVTSAVKVIPWAAQLELFHDSAAATTRVAVKRGKVDLKPVQAHLPAQSLGPGESANVGRRTMTVTRATGTQEFGRVDTSTPAAGKGRVVALPKLNASLGAATAAERGKLEFNRPVMIVRKVEEGVLKEHGIRVGDQLLAVNGHDTDTPEALRVALARAAKEPEVEYVFLRGEEVLVVLIPRD